MNPIIVIGPPRSGTTMTARVLQEWFGIVMDGCPMRPDKIINPYGWYEDFRLVEANQLFAYGSIKINAWTRRFKRYIRAMERLDTPWGFKDPRIIPLLSYALSFFDYPTVIRCHRPKELVVKSYIEKFGWDERTASDRWDRDEFLLDHQLKNITHYRFDFNDYISEMQIFEFLKNTMVIRHAA